MRGPNKSTRRSRHHTPAHSRQRRATQLSGWLPTCSVRHHVPSFRWCWCSVLTTTSQDYSRAHTSIGAVQQRGGALPRVRASWALNLPFPYSIIRRHAVPVGLDVFCWGYCTFEEATKTKRSLDAIGAKLKECLVRGISPFRHSSIGAWKV